MRETGSLALWATLAVLVQVAPAFGEGPPCPEHAPSVSVPVPPPNHTPRPEYPCKTVEYCLPKLSKPFGLFHGKDCHCLDCGSPRQKRVLLKRIVTDECPDTTCEVRQAPECLTCPPAPCPPTAKP